jgi:hypothetical protein
MHFSPTALVMGMSSAHLLAFGVNYLFLSRQVARGGLAYEVREVHSHWFCFSLLSYKAALLCHQ